MPSHRQYCKRPALYFWRQWLRAEFQRYMDALDWSSSAWAINVKRPLKNARKWKLRGCYICSRRYKSESTQMYFSLPKQFLWKHVQRWHARGPGIRHQRVGHQSANVQKASGIHLFWPISQNRERWPSHRRTCSRQQIWPGPTEKIMRKVPGEPDWIRQCNRAPVPEWHASSRGAQKNVHKLHNDVLWHRHEKRRF